MAIDARLADALDRLPDYLGSHVLVSVTALAIGLGISLPLALFAARRPKLRAGALAFASIVQTIPGLALLALFYPLLLALSGLCERLFGADFSALGFLPSVLALALYSMLPVLRNTVTGLAGVNPSLREAASLIGANPWQVMRDIELPLATPVIMAGVRTSAVWVIGTATLSTPIGQTSLGNYIFAGLQTQNWVFVLFGCAAAAVLALVVDQLLASIEHGAAVHSRARVAAGALGLAVVVLAALLPGGAFTQARYVIGTKPFTEQYVLAALIAQRLEASHLPTARLDGLGSAVILNALAANEIDVYVDYSGTIWADDMHRSDVRPRADVVAAVGRWLRQNKGIRLLGSLGFENAYALAMTRKKAAALGITSIADLAAHAPSLSIAGDYEFFERPEWKAISAAYGLRFEDQRTMQPDFMYAALANGDVDVAAVYTSDGRIAQYDLKVLGDPKQAIPPYDAIVLLAPRRVNDDKLIAALRPLIGAIPVSLMRAANRRASEKGALPKDAARWLWEKIEKK
ncbi:MAG TPA: ABC transporter permease/substrate-binding protein [Pseudolabrys sp.]|nr:ABC transporter permease/substrate-binding protein [Pseudolabrys sp.]